jgi:hypothetical protein
MDPVTLIVGALAAGAAAGLTDTATNAVKDTYSQLRALVARLFRGRPDGETALRRHAEAPQVWQAPLAGELQAAGAGTDEAIIAAAQRLMAVVDEAGSQAGKYRLDLRGAQVGQVGDHNTQTVTFTSPPTGS